MGMRDKECIYSDGQSIAFNTAVPSTNVYDSGVTGDEQSADIGLMRQLWLVCTIIDPFDAWTTATISFQHSLDNVNWTTAFQFIAKNISGFENQTLLEIPLPTGLNRYTRIQWNVAGSSGSVEVSSWLALNLQNNKFRASGFLVDLIPLPEPPVPPIVTSAILQENGGYFLTESGGYILLEQ